MASPVFVSVPSKLAEAVNFAAPLGTFIASEYAAETGNYSAPIAELNHLRETCVQRRPEVHESGLKALNRYYGQFLGLMQRFPLATAEQWNGTLPVPIKITFVWNDLFEGAGIFSKKKVALQNAHYERVCVLFNIAALQSQIGAAQSFSYDEGLKTAATNFQNAAISLRHLASTVQAHFKSPPSNDLQPALLGALSELMLAQAQETLWHKTISGGKMKDAVVAKLAMAAADLYGRAGKSLGTCAEVDRAWIAMANAKRCFFAADAHQRMGTAAAEAGAYGEQVARLRLAHQLMQQANKQTGSSSFDVKAAVANLTRALETAEKENQIIYLALVPDAATLPNIAPHALVSADKPLPDYTSAELRGPDLFASLLPLALVHAVSAYKEKLQSLVQENVDKLRNSTAETVGTLASLNLPGAIEVVESPATIPDSLLQASRSLQEAGGVAAVTRLIGNLPSLNKKCTDILDETFKLLDSELKEDQSMREHHGSRWTRTPSAELTVSTRAEADKYRSIVLKAYESDQTVKQRFAENEAGFVVLSKERAELEQMLPQGPAAATDNSEKTTLKALLQQLDELRTRRDGLEQQLRARGKSDDDISDRLLASSGTGTGMTDDSVIDQQLAAVQPLVAEVDAVVAQTTQKMTEVVEQNSKFVGKRSGGQDGARERMISDLIQKKEAFLEVKTNLDEGAKFYGSLTSLLMKFQNKVKDFTSARRLEKQTMLNDLSQSIAQSAPESYATHASLAAAPQRPPPSATQSASAPQQPPLQQPQPPMQLQPPARPSGPPPQQAPYYAGGGGGGYTPAPGSWQQPPPPQWQQQQPSPYYGGPMPYGQPPPYQGGYVPAYQAPPSHGPAPGEWACRVCTFHNKHAAPKCEMCDTPRA